MVGTELRVLWKKEWRQLLRSKAAMASALVLPLIVMVVVPGLMLHGPQTGPGAELPKLPPGLPSAFAKIASDPRQVMTIILPALFGMAGLFVPSISATYTLISERESKTLELLVALPVRVGQILAAKLLALVALASLVILPLFLIDVLFILRGPTIKPLFVVLLLPVLVASIAFSTASALLVSLIARDFRTANNINGALMGPSILVSMAVTFLTLDPVWAAVALTFVYAVAAVICGWVAIRGVTFERLLR